MIGTSGFQEVRSSSSRSSTYRLLREQLRQIEIWFLTPFLSLIICHTVGNALAETSPITTSGLNTQINLSATPPAGIVQYDITGGTRPGGGTNLFHSFGDFNVPNHNIANFLNDSGLATSNILGRVTGGNLSNIFGTIQTTGFGTANLFLMNPAGFLFGPNATVNVGGMVTFTSADYLRLADGVRFNAIPNPTLNALMSTAPVAAFGFLGSNPGAITVQGSQFTVTEGTGISLVGRNITVQSGILDDGITNQAARFSAPNGKIQLASAASPGEFAAATLQPLPNVSGTSFTSFGSVSLASGSNINVTGEQTISIRGGQFVLSVNDAVLTTADSADPRGTISLSPTSSIISSNAGADAGADVQLIASNVQMDGASIQSLTTGDGTGGTISITAPLDGGPNSSTAGRVQIKGGQIQTASLGPGTVGDIQINSSSLSMTDGALIVSLLVPNPLIPGQPGGGTIAITATDSIFVTGQRLGTTTLLPSVPGLPTFTNLPSGIYSENFSPNAGSSIVIQTPSLTLQPGLIDSHTFGPGAGGDVSLLLGQLTLKDGGLITSNTFGTGAGASLQIMASDSITMSGFLPGTFQFGPVVLQDIGSNIANVTYGLGQAGQVSVSTSTLTLNGANISSSTNGPGGAGDVNLQAATISMTGGAVISTSTLGSGPGGTVSMTASEQLSISGRSGRSLGFGSFTAVNNPSAITAMTLSTGRAGTLTVNTPSLIMFDGGLISTATGGDSPAGSIAINAGMIHVNSGASISSTSGFDVGVGGFLFGNGAGGTVTVNATGPVTIADQGSGLFTNTVGSGPGGNIFVSADSVTLQNGGTLSAATSGPADTSSGGTIAVTATDTITMTSGASISANSTGPGNAGNITAMASSFSMSERALISAGTGKGTTGHGGNISVQADEVLLTDNAGITTNTLGSGDAGAIAITAQDRISLTDSRMNSSTFAFPDKPEGGQGGQITLHAPTIDISNGQIVSLSQSSGNAGNVLLETAYVTLDASELLASAFGSGSGGDITIRGLTDAGSSAGQVALMGASQVLSETSNTGNGGTLAIQTAQLMMQDFSLISTSSLGEGTVGNAGNVILNASQSLRLTSGSLIQSGSIALSEGNAGAIAVTAPAITLDAGTISTTTEFFGSAGTVMIKTNSLTVQNGGQIASSSVIVEDIPAGSAGNVTIQGLASPAESVLIDGFGSGIFTDTQGTGAGGNISVKANFVTLQNSGTLSAATSGTEVAATGGTITVDAANTVTMNSASITASSTGVAAAGGITLTGLNGFTMQNSSIATQAGQGAGGGNIKVTTSPDATVLLQNSKISASVADGHGGGGNISIDPQFVILQNSQILAQADEGQGGTITIIANLFLPDASSVINADSGSGVNGTITIQSPNAPVSGHIQPLNKTPLLATTLLNQHCAAVADGAFSSFTVAGRDSLPTEPGSWLSSPLYAASVGLGIKAEGVKAEGEKLEGMSVSAGQGWSDVVRGGLAAHQIDQTNQINQTNPALLLLRQIAPAGFLTQAFALDQNGCTS